MGVHIVEGFRNVVGKVGTFVAKVFKRKDAVPVIQLPAGADLLEREHGKLRLKHTGVKASGQQLILEDELLKRREKQRLEEERRQEAIVQIKKAVEERTAKHKAAGEVAHAEAKANKRLLHKYANKKHTQGVYGVAYQMGLKGQATREGEVLSYDNRIIHLHQRAPTKHPLVERQLLMRGKAT